MKKLRIKKSLLGFMLTLSILISSVMPLTVSAAGVENLPHGEYSIGSFSFTNTNLTPVKTVTGGSNVKFSIDFQKASFDTGIGPVKLTVQVRDANTGAILRTSSFSLLNNTSGGMEFSVDLGYTGRRVQIWFDASSVYPAQSNGNFRSISITKFNSHVK